MMKAANYINHIALVLDASQSMDRLSSQVVQVADQQIAHLAQRSKELNQETRVTVYTFNYNHSIECHFYDMDALRLPSLKGCYVAKGQTALVDATLKAISDLEKTAQLYGDHSFLVYVLTDGEENNSRATTDVLAMRLNNLPENWTVAAFVPNAMGLHEAKKCGFYPNNLSVWSTDASGMKEVGETIRRTTDAYMTGRASGVRGSRNLFAVDTSKLYQGLKPTNRMVKLLPGQFRKLRVRPSDVLPGRKGIPIAEFIERETRRPYVLGEAFYQLTVPVKVQPQKQIALYERKGHNVYVGQDARQLLGLPDYEVKVAPANHPNYDIFIQSTSTNRILLADTDVLLLSGQR